MRLSVISFLIILLFNSCNTPKILSNDKDFRVDYILSGNISDHSATVIVKANKIGTVKIRIIESGNSKEIHNKSFTISDKTDFVLKQSFDKLKPLTSYVYQIESLKSNVIEEGNFKTFSTDPFSYKMVFGSCMVTGSNSDIFLKIRDENPLFFLQTGDLHYENIDSNCTPRFHDAYYKTFTSPNQSALYRSTPLVYIWDDHDFGPNNASSTNPCRKESVAAYQSHIPHFPMGLKDEKGPISQSFSVGRVHYILTDLRSQKVHPVYADCDRQKSGSNFGSEEHLSWFFNEMLRAKKDGKVVAWVSGYAWINGPNGPNYKCNETDNWGGYPEERQRIANFIKLNKIPIMILSGDAHMVAMDDGSHSDYATDGGAPVRVFHAAAIDRYGSYKGGPYSQGYSKELGQYGVIEVTDNSSDKICFRWYAKNKMGQRVVNTEGLEIKMNFCMDVATKQ